MMTIPIHVMEKSTCMGDGLLAVCQGDHHEARGLDFARRLVRKATRVSRVRTAALEEPYGLALRAGVASGEVVMGAVGSLFKLEFAAIGVPTNRAARLQGAAREGEVVCASETAIAALAAGGDVSGGVEETITLKGFGAGERVIRFVADRAGEALGEQGERDHDQPLDEN